MAKILILNGPNLNLLGTREPEHYGALTLGEIEARLRALAADAGCEIDFRQSNAEHELIDWIQRAAREQVDFIIINPAAFTHTSVAMRDALAAVEIPFFEVHLSNVHAREPFRRHSYFSDLASGVVAGFGARGYEFALQAAMGSLQARQEQRS
ncbi:MAG: type II 3-dehydroquinate dehydratase [Pseudomonadota bacterium]|nr:type II 3-dehydroquinate dehydratase [Pseudomonadota bacterium]